MLEPREAELARNAALEEHLQRVRYPRSGDEFFEVAKEAIAAIDAGESEHAVTTPAGRSASAESIVAGLALEPFLADAEDEL